LSDELKKEVENVAVVKKALAQKENPKKVHENS